MFQHYKTGLIIAISECQIFQQQRLILSTWYGMIIGVMNQLPEGRLITLSNFLHEWGNIFFLWSRCLPLKWNIPVPPHAELFSRPSSVDLQHTLSTVIIFHTSLLLDRKHYNKFEWSNRPTLTAFTVYTMIPNILKQPLSWCFRGGMTFEDLVTAPARWQYLARLRLCSHRSL